MYIHHSLWKTFICTFLLEIVCCSFTFSYSERNGSNKISSVGKSYETNLSESEAKNSSNDSYYPFILSQTNITAEEVAGMQIKDKKLTLLSFNNTCSVKELPNENDFSDLNFFRRYPKLLSVELNGIQLSTTILENLQKFLPKDLKSFSVSNCDINKEDAELLADILEKHNSLESVSVIFPDSSGEESARILGSLSDHANIKYLNIVFGELTKEGCEHLVSLITESARVLKSLSLGWNKITDDKNLYKKITEAVCKIKKLKKFEFSTMFIDERESKLIFDVIGKLTHLSALKIFFGNTDSHNHIKLFENTEILRDSLSSLKMLETLDVSFMQLPNEVMQLISQSIKSMGKLKTLNISGNKLDEKSAESLSESIKETDSITTLIANNCCIDANAFAALCKSFANTSMKYLYFRGNQIKSGVKSLPIANMPEVLIVDFSQNDMNYDDAMAFIELTKNNKTLYAVNFKNNSEIESMNSTDRTIRNDQLVEWKLKNYSDHQVSFFGL